MGDALSSMFTDLMGGGNSQKKEPDLFDVNKFDAKKADSGAGWGEGDDLDLDFNLGNDIKVDDIPIDKNEEKKEDPKPSVVNAASGETGGGWDDDDIIDV